MASPTKLVAAGASSLGRRRSVLLAGALLAALAWAAGGLWRGTQDSLKNNPRHLVTAEGIEFTTPPPPWIRTDVRAQAYHQAGMQGPLSMVEPSGVGQRLHQSFSAHPWVKQVERVELLPPNRVAVDLTWRKPVAAFLLETDPGPRLLLLDEQLVRLPEHDLRESDLRRLPRITGIANNVPPIGQAWADARVAGAMWLITRFGKDWDNLALADVSANPSPGSHGEKQYYHYELISTGETRILWGAAPDVSLPNEAPFDAKLAWLKRYLTESGDRLDSEHSPRLIDLRGPTPLVAPRIAKKEGKRTAQNTTGEDSEAEQIK